MTDSRGVVLVVEDEPAIADLLRMYLSREGFQVLVEAEGQEALTAVADHRPSCILLDVGLPGMDGNEVARQLRQRPEFERTLLVALTGWGQESDRQKSAQAGFDRHLVKPVDPEVIRGLLTDPRPVSGSADLEES